MPLNPVSLCQILGHEVDKEELLKKIIKKFSEFYRLLEMGGYNDISAMYHEALYRRGGFHSSAMLMVSLKALSLK